jgi:nitrite reductase (NADH) small subunit
MSKRVTQAPNSERWVDIGPLEAVPLQGARVVRTAAGCIAVFRTAHGEAFAIDDRCPHKGGPLSQGIVHGTSVTCPLHGMVISLETGEALGADKGVVATIPLRIEAGRILLDAAKLPQKTAA